MPPPPPSPAPVNLVLQHWCKALQNLYCTIRRLFVLFVAYSRTIRTIRRLFADYSYYSGVDYSRTIRTIRRLFVLFVDYSHYSLHYSSFINCRIHAIFLNKTLSRRPDVKDNDWIIFLEYDAYIKPLYNFCILYPNQESLTHSPEVFHFSSRVFSHFAFAKSKNLLARVTISVWYDGKTFLPPPPRRQHFRENFFSRCPPPPPLPNLFMLPTPLYTKNIRKI